MVTGWKRQFNGMQSNNARGVTICSVICGRNVTVDPKDSGPHFAAGMSTEAGY